ncbi:MULTISPECIES: SymE family type I addiction module toxin [Stenotrophomonas]|uniref:SymE family type I addiction module toxin n=1 Tax=Stenotrophomonas TaxID=40323 RepID=UPI000A04F24D|nr:MULTISPECIES: SymE family type I addiction module toxin [Stenotrophomonas]
MSDHERDSSVATPPRVIYHWNTPRSVLVGSLYHDEHEPEPGELLVPSVHLRGMWLKTAGIETGARLSVHIASGCVLLRSRKPVRVACRRPGWYT